MRGGGIKSVKSLKIGIGLYENILREYNILGDEESTVCKRVKHKRWIIYYNVL